MFCLSTFLSDNAALFISVRLPIFLVVRSRNTVGLDLSHGLLNSERGESCLLFDFLQGLMFVAGCASLPETLSHTQVLSTHTPFSVGFSG